MELLGAPVLAGDGRDPKAYGARVERAVRRMRKAGLLLKEKLSVTHVDKLAACLRCMVQPDPNKRPTITSAESQLLRIVNSSGLTDRFDELYVVLDNVNITVTGPPEQE